MPPRPGLAVRAVREHFLWSPVRWLAVASKLAQVRLTEHSERDRSSPHSLKSTSTSARFVCATARVAGDTVMQGPSAPVPLTQALCQQHLRECVRTMYAGGQALGCIGTPIRPHACAVVSMLSMRAVSLKLFIGAEKPTGFRSQLIGMVQGAADRVLPAPAAVVAQATVPTRAALPAAGMYPYHPPPCRARRQAGSPVIRCKR